MTAKAKPKAQSKLVDNRVEALRSETRRKIMRVLVTEGPSSPSKMARVLEEKLANVNYHTKKLADLGMVELADERPSGGSIEHVYRATERRLVETNEWDDLDPATKEGESGEYAQLLIDDIVAGFRAETLGTHPDFALIQDRLVVDKQGLKEVIKLVERHLGDYQDLQARVLKRLSADDPGVNISLLLAAFEIPPPDENHHPENT